jgi:chemotaxis protein methyltransferase CheR
MSDEDAFEELLGAILDRWHYDFRNYARASLRRRVGATMMHLGCASFRDLTVRLVRDEDAFRAALGILTVPVSEMFRDPLFYTRMRDLVVPELATYPSLKIWVAGCSTGEEALSLAVLLHEEGLLARTLIYATDINPLALDAARRGTFPAHRVVGYEESHFAARGRGSLLDYATPRGEMVTFKPELLSRIVFADHSLATDQVFSEVQLVTCRNVLIYFDRALQARAVGLFKEALCRRGFLGLGPRETLRFSPHSPAFRELDDGFAWYQRC